MKTLFYLTLLLLYLKNGKNIDLGESAYTQYPSEQTNNDVKIENKNGMDNLAYNYRIENQTSEISFQRDIFNNNTSASIASIEQDPPNNKGQNMPTSLTDPTIDPYLYSYDSEKVRNHQYLQKIPNDHLFILRNNTRINEQQNTSENFQYSDEQTPTNQKWITKKNQEINKDYINEKSLTDLSKLQSANDFLNDIMNNNYYSPNNIKVDKESDGSLCQIGLIQSPIDINKPIDGLFTDKNLTFEFQIDRNGGGDDAYSEYVNIINNNVFGTYFIDDISKFNLSISDSSYKNLYGELKTRKSHIIDLPHIQNNAKRKILLKIKSRINKNKAYHLKNSDIKRNNEYYDSINQEIDQNKLYQSTQLYNSQSKNHNYSSISNNYQTHQPNFNKVTKEDNNFRTTPINGVFRYESRKIERPNENIRLSFQHLKYSYNDKFDNLKFLTKSFSQSEDEISSLSRNANISYCFNELLKFSNTQFSSDNTIIDSCLRKHEKMSMFFIENIQQADVLKNMITDRMGLLDRHFNGPHTPEFYELNSRNIISTEPNTFELNNIQLHLSCQDKVMGSEHSIFGEKFDMEVHFIFNRKPENIQDKNSSLLGGISSIYVTLLVRAGKIKKGMLDSFFEHYFVKTEQNGERNSFGYPTLNPNIFDIKRNNEFLVKLLNFIGNDSLSKFIYKGSMNKSPCSEDVLYIIYEKPIVISLETFQRLRATKRYFSGNETINDCDNFRYTQKRQKHNIFKYHVPTVSDHEKNNRFMNHFVRDDDF